MKRDNGTNDKRKTNPGSAEGSMIMDEVYLLTNDVPWLTSFNKKLLENDWALINGEIEW